MRNFLINIFLKKPNNPSVEEVISDINKFVPASIQTLCANNGFKIKPEHISHIEIDRAGGLLRLREDISIWDEKILCRNSMKYPDDYVKCVNCGEEFPRGARCSNKLHTALVSIGKRNTI